MTSRRRMEDSELWRAMGRIEAGQSITVVALFFGVHHSVISCLWFTDSCPKTCSRSPKGYNPRGRSIYCYFSQAESQSHFHTCDTYGYIVHWYGDILSYSTPKITYECIVRPGTSSLCFSIRPIKRGTIKVVPGTCQLDWVWLGQCHVYWWVKICSGASQITRV